MGFTGLAANPQCPFTGNKRDDASTIVLTFKTISNKLECHFSSRDLEFNSTVSSHQRRLKTSKLLAVVLVLQNVSYRLHQGLVSVSIATQFDIA